MLASVLAAHLHQTQHGKQRKGELHYHQYRRHGAEAVIAGNIVCPPFGEPHHIAAPTEHDGEYGSHEKRPFHRTFYYKHSQQGKYQHKGAHIYRAVRAGLLAEILRIGLQQLIFHWRDDAVVIQLLGFLCLGQSGGCQRAFGGLHAGAALDVGDEQREGLAFSVAPVSHVIERKTAVAVGGNLFALHGRQLSGVAANGLLGIGIGVIERR